MSDKPYETVPPNPYNPPAEKDPVVLNEEKTEKDPVVLNKGNPVRAVTPDELPTVVLDDAATGPVPETPSPEPPDSPQTSGTPSPEQMMTPPPRSNYAVWVVIAVIALAIGIAAGYFLSQADKPVTPPDEPVTTDETVITDETVTPVDTETAQEQTDSTSGETVTPVDTETAPDPVSDPEPNSDPNPESVSESEPEPVVRYQGTFGDLSWTLDENGLLTVSGTGKMGDFSEDDAQNKDKAWWNFREDIQTVIIEEGAVNLGFMAFDRCPNLTDIQIADSVTSIDGYALRYCDSLTELTIPAGVQRVGAFIGCYALTAIHVVPENTAFVDEDGVLFNHDKTRLIRYPAAKAGKEYLIPNSVTSMEQFAFERCSNLERIVLSENLEAINAIVFQACNNLKSMTIPNGITAVHAAAFFNCSSLAEVFIPDSVTYIGYEAFVGCTALTEITIPDSVTSIGERAFANCTALKEISIPAGLSDENIGKNAFPDTATVTRREA